jgi:hypothetical protein
MKLKSKAHISNNNKNIVYVINNNPPRRRRQNKRKSSMNDTTQGHPTEANADSNSITLPDNRFLNSSNLGTEIQRANLKLIDNPQLRMNEPNTPLLENSYDQRLMQIQDALQQQIENTRFGMNYLYSRFDSSKPVIEELPNENDNFGTFAETEGSNFFVNEGDSRPDFDEPKQPIINDINDTPIRQSTQTFTDELDSASPSPYPDVSTIRIPEPRKIKMKRTGFQSPMGYKPQEPNFDEIDITEPKYIPDEAEPILTPIKPQADAVPQPIGKMELKKLELRQEYKSLNGQNSHILYSPLNHLSVTQMRMFVTNQKKINDKLNQYEANGGDDPNILKSQSLNVITEAVQSLIRQSNSRKPRR